MIRLDLADFRPIASLDSYAFSTLCYETPQPPKAATSHCIQLGIRGTLMPPCEQKPCDGHMAIEVRTSANAAYDGADTDPTKPGDQLRPESEMCGSGTRPPRWIPLGPVSPSYEVVIEWGPASGGDGVLVTTAAGSERLTQGMRNPGFGNWTEGIPCAGSKCGIGWSYNPNWTVGPQGPHGGRAFLERWESRGALPIASRCP